MIAPLFGSITRPLLSPLVSGLRDELFGAFTPRSLFNDGSIGVLYDNNDLTTMFVDAAGTTPATVNGLVGLQLDKSANLALGAEVWSSASPVFLGEATQVSSGVYRIYSSAGAYSSVGNSSGLTVGRWYRAEFTVDSVTVAGGGITIEATNAPTYTTVGNKVFYFLATGTSPVIKRASSACDIQISGVSFRELPGNHRYQATTGSKPILRGTPTGGNLVTNGGFDTDTDWTKGTGWSIGSGVATKTAGTADSIFQAYSFVVGKVYRVTYTVTRTAGAVVIRFSGGTVTAGANRSASGTYVEYLTAQSGNAFVSILGDASFAGTVDNVEVVDVSAGSVTAPYGLQYDGVDDFLQTASVNFTATDKMTAIAGARKFVDTATGILVELSANTNTNNGSFYISAPNSAAANFGFSLRGDSGVPGTVVTGYAAPTTRVLTGIYDIAGSLVTDEVKQRIDGVAVGTASGPVAGGGSFGNYALYFGRRGGTTFPFNGLDFGFVIVGKTLTSAQISSTERYIAQRTGINI